MNPLAAQVMLNEMARHKQADALGKPKAKKRKAAQAAAVKDEPPGMEHAKGWNDLHAFSEMRLELCDSARETLRRLKNG